MPIQLQDLWLAIEIEERKNQLMSPKVLDCVFFERIKLVNINVERDVYI